MARRILTIVLAIALALIGCGAVLVYVKGADQRAIAGQKAATVLVAAQQIPAGTSASTAFQDGMLIKQTVPASSVPSEAVRSIGPAVGSLVLSAALPPGELLLRPMLVTSVLATSGLAIPQGMVAVTISMCLPGAVANYVYPGSQVAVFDTTFTKVQPGQSTNCDSSGQVPPNPDSVRTRIVLTRVTVLAVGQAAAQATTGSSTTSTAFNGGTSGSSSSSSNGGVLVTLAVSQDDAERVITLARAGVPWLALLSPSSVTGADSPVLQFFPNYK